ncbi:MAG: ExeM/NucH family extracellular endonuclease, partial [Myxococcota bacterium]|nr:ExeM/NucH family extracellular endonuclease [Myxococcota bacterium]
MKTFFARYSHCGLACALLMAISGRAEAVTINEIRIDQPDADNDEFVELIANPGTSLDGLTYLVIGDSSSDNGGVVEAVVRLSGTVGSTGFFVVAESTFSSVADATADLNFENSDNVTHLLVSGFSGTLSMDLDPNNDGVLDFTPWTNIEDSVAVMKSASGGDLVYSAITVGPDDNGAPGHVIRCSFEEWIVGSLALGSDDTPGSANPCGDDGGDTDEEPDEEPTILPIFELQGTGTESPYEGQAVHTQGVVVADFQGAHELKGFFVQDPLGDGDALTSDGLFVYADEKNDVSVGDLVQIAGSVTEYLGTTEIANVSSISVLGTGQSIEPTVLVLPEETEGDLERYEGMLVTIGAPLTVTQCYFLGRYGQLTLASADDEGVPGRLFQPVELFPAQSLEAVELAEENARRILFLDDGRDTSKYGDNPNPVPYIGPAPGTALRAGDLVTGLVGVLHEGRINSAPTPGLGYRVHPTKAPTFDSKNPRTFAPVVAGDLRVASLNVLNYFKTIDDGKPVCGPNKNMECRGADSEDERSRQETKLVSALVAMDGDIVALMEIENNGQGKGSAVERLVTLVNDALGEELYAAVDIGSPSLGGDAISVALIYNTQSVALVGEPATLDTGAFDQTIEDGGRNRQPLAATFEELETTGKLTVVVNHFKSKSTPSSVQGNANDDQGDGQGAWNARRVEAAIDLAAWLATDPTACGDADVLLLGDFNAYSAEEPILTLEERGYLGVLETMGSLEDYSYIFDGMAGALDHALATASLAEQIVDAAHWHINADEPAVLDYNVEVNSEPYWVADLIRCSDHDPVIVGLVLASDGPQSSDEDTNTDSQTHDESDTGQSSDESDTGQSSDESDTGQSSDESDTGQSSDESDTGQSS